MRVKPGSQLWHKHRYKHGDVHTSDTRMCSVSHVGNFVPTAFSSPEAALLLVAILGADQKERGLWA